MTLRKIFTRPSALKQICNFMWLSLFVVHQDNCVNRLKYACLFVVVAYVYNYCFSSFVIRIIIVCSQGNKQNDMWIFALTVLLTSTLIYNGNITIDQNIINDLQYPLICFLRKYIINDGASAMFKIVIFTWMSYFQFLWRICCLRSYVTRKIIDVQLLYLRDSELFTST